MPLHKIGRVGIVFYSEWEENRVYSYLDYVRTDGNCYMCVAEHLSDELNKPKDGEDSTFWRVVVDNSTTKLELLQNIDEKLETTKAELRAYIGEIMANLNKAVIVDTLPDTGEIGTLYLVANGGSDDNIYDEYIYINKGSEANPNFVFEKLGSRQVEVNLDGYYDKNKIDEKLSKMPKFADFVANPFDAYLNENQELNEVDFSSIGIAGVESVSFGDQNWNIINEYTYTDEQGNNVLKKDYQAQIETHFVFKDGSEKTINLYYFKSTTEPYTPTQPDDPMPPFDGNKIDTPLKLSNPQSAIDTGLKMDSEYVFEVGGRIGSNQCVLIGAEKSTSERTLVAFLPKSNKIQHKWASNKENLASVNGNDIPLENNVIGYKANKNGIEFNNEDFVYNHITADGTIIGDTIDITPTYSGSDENTALYLLNNQLGGAFGNGSLYYAKIYKNDELLRHFVAWRDKNGVYCFKDLVSGNKFYPIDGVLEVDNSQGKNYLLSADKEAIANVFQNLDETIFYFEYTPIGESYPVSILPQNVSFDNNILTLNYMKEGESLTFFGGINNNNFITENRASSFDKNGNPCPVFNANGKTFGIFVNNGNYYTHYTNYTDTHYDDAIDNYYYTGFELWEMRDNAPYRLVAPIKIFAPYYGP